MWWWWWCFFFSACSRLSSYRGPRPITTTKTKTLHCALENQDHSGRLYLHLRTEWKAGAKWSLALTPAHGAESDSTVVAVEANTTKNNARNAHMYGTKTYVNLSLLSSVFALQTFSVSDDFRS
jgi:hypothetical protein